jgi:hypothetical protein
MSLAAPDGRPTLAHRAFPKTQLLKALKTGEAVTIPELSTRLPEFKWRELFLIVKALNRQGAIRLHRQGYEFFVTSLPGPSHVPSSAACGPMR